MAKQLLSIVELGGYPDFSALYQTYGFETTSVSSTRKALSYLKKNCPDVIVAEFNFQSDFRDRSSSLESIFAKIQGQQHIKIILLYEKNHQSHLPKITSRFDVFETIAFPITEKKIMPCLERL